MQDEWIWFQSCNKPAREWAGSPLSMMHLWNEYNIKLSKQRLWESSIWKHNGQWQRKTVVNFLFADPRGYYSAPVLIFAVFCILWLNNSQMTSHSLIELKQHETKARLNQEIYWESLACYTVLKLKGSASDLRPNG